MKKKIGIFKIIKYGLLFFFAIFLAPLAIVLAGIYGIYYAKKNKFKIQEKFNLPKNKWYSNPVLYSLMAFVLSFFVAGKVGDAIYLNSSQQTVTQQTKKQEKVGNEHSNNNSKKVIVADKEIENNDKAKKETETKESVDNSINKNTNSFSEAKVTKVVDGDTIYVNLDNKEYKIRMIGVDTPETVHPSNPVQFYGKEASDFTKNSLNSKTVYLQKDVSETDKYGRLLRYVWLARPNTNEPTEAEIIDKMFNAKLIKDGYGQAYTYQPDSKYSEFFNKLQREARNNGIGLWNEAKSQEFNQTADSNSTNSKSVNSNSESTDSSNSFGKDYSADTTYGKIKGNSKSMIYHVPGGASYNKISKNNVVYFNSEEEAQAAGYRRAKR
ncbi:thermonuclease family protein [Peptostreptococcus canis]|uniref:Nuclease n=1 Tax=Peptostreptococcus canis TaxID=1159213 RepID=A0ABR6TIF4_9FIRM|nr:thermonuclease family protein [Peptostreptococcus canis]MBC2575191.1 nuclease [Peptostreptococcus canis]MBP1997634.1 micrococcal nuclease [Peptostreptococcus canis]